MMSCADGTSRVSNISGTRVFVVVERTKGVPRSVTVQSKLAKATKPTIIETPQSLPVIPLSSSGLPTFPKVASRRQQSNNKLDATLYYVVRYYARRSNN